MLSGDDTEEDGEGEWTIEVEPESDDDENVPLMTSSTSPMSTNDNHLVDVDSYGHESCEIAVQTDTAPNHRRKRRLLNVGTSSNKGKGTKMSVEKTMQVLKRIKMLSRSGKASRRAIYITVCACLFTGVGIYLSIFVMQGRALSR